MSSLTSSEPGIKEAKFKLSEKLYVTVLVLVGLLSYGYKLNTQGIFACPAEGYSDGSYLAYCNATAYGDFDHGALWYPLVPDTVVNARTADVLFVGSSRMQFGFSSDVTQDWFDGHNATYYLLGFTHTENANFTGPLVEKIQPNPRILIINADGFFEGRMTSPASRIFGGGDAPAVYNAKHLWQPVHRKLCGFIEPICGQNYAIYRQGKTGRWERYGIESGAQPSSTGISEENNTEAWRQELSLARAFLSRFEINPQCIFMTVVPSQETPLLESQWFSTHLNLPLVTPKITGLQTFDGSHLDKKSAERWSRAFFAQSSPLLQKCLTKSIPLSTAES